MKKNVLAATAALVLSAFASSAFAGDLDTLSRRLPDGSTLMVISTKQGGLAAPGASSVTRILCSAPPATVCQIIGSDVQFQDGIIPSVTRSVAGAVGLREFGRGLRPDRSDTYVSSYSDSSAASGSSSNAQQGQCEGSLLCANDFGNDADTTTTGGDDYDFDDDGKG
jgi:hypothetical protein